MIEKIYQYVNFLFNQVFYFLIGIVGGIIKISTQKEKRYSAKEIIASLLISGFTAVMTKNFLVGFGLINADNLDALVFFCGMSGYLGNYLLDKFAVRILKFINGNNHKQNPPV